MNPMQKIHDRMTSQALLNQTDRHNRQQLTHTDRAISVLLIGDGRHREFRDSLAVVCCDATVVRATDVSAACEMLADGRLAPDIIIVETPRPGQWRTDLLDKMVSLTPLSRVLLLLGSWCKGEERTGCPWPGGRRIFWYDWLPQWRRELAAIRANRCPIWGLPMTTTREELLLNGTSETDPPESIAVAAGLLVVSTRYLETADALSDAAQVRGYSTVWARTAEAARQIRGASVAIWEGIDGGAHDVLQIGQLRDALGDVPIVAILDFPRVDREEALRVAGVVGMVGKPFQLDDLFARVEQAAKGAANQPTARPASSEIGSAA